MLIEVTTKDTEGNIAFTGKLNAREASLVLNVGINYLMANGVMPLFTGKDDDELGVVSPMPARVQ